MRLADYCRATLLKTLIMIRFILVQVRFITPFYLKTILIVFFYSTRIAKARHGCPNGMFHTMMKKRCALFERTVPGLQHLVQLRLRGEVHRVVAARDQKYQSNFVEVSKPRFCHLLA